MAAMAAQQSYVHYCSKSAGCFVCWHGLLMAFDGVYDCSSSSASRQHLWFTFWGLLSSSMLLRVLCWVVPGVEQQCCCTGVCTTKSLSSGSWRHTVHSSSLQISPCSCCCEVCSRQHLRQLFDWVVQEVEQVASAACSRFICLNQQQASQSRVKLCDYAADWMVNALYQPGVC